MNMRHDQDPHIAAGVTPPMNRADRFYKHLGDLSASPFAALQCTNKIYDYMGKAQRGDRDAESMLCAWIGSIRKTQPTFESLPQVLQEAIRQGGKYLLSVGRVLNLRSENPRDWISQRDGSPRW